MDPSFGLQKRDQGREDSPGSHHDNPDQDQPVNEEIKPLMKRTQIGSQVFALGGHQYRSQNRSEDRSHSPDDSV